MEGEVKNETEFGLFIGLDGDVDGMVHLSDLDWKRPGEQVIDKFKKGDMVKARVLDVDVEKERISLGIKQLAGRSLLAARRRAAEGVKKGAVVTCEVIEVKEVGLEVQDRRNRSRPSSSVGTGAVTVPISAPSVSPSARRSTPRIIPFDSSARKVRCRSRPSKWPKKRKPSRSFGSSNSGASLGDILGNALKKRGDK